jgi:hypothetical protein
MLDNILLMYYSNYMANILSAEKQTAIIAGLVEGSSIRSIERITGVHMTQTILQILAVTSQSYTRIQ